MENVVQAATESNRQQRKVSLNAVPNQPDEKDEDTRKAELGIYDPDVGSPLVRLMYEFFTDPHSSNTAYIWGQITAWLAIIRVLEIAFESCDGPNQYVGRTQDNSRYYFFLTDKQYWRLYIACMVPIIIDAVSKMIMLGFVVFASENNALYYKLRKDGLERFLLLADILGIIPFMITAIYLRPYAVADNQAQNVVMTLLELLITARILRLIKNMPAIRAIRIALLNSVDHLVLPLFFFFTFNITVGVFLYFVEPCYNTDLCPWQDLFESSFYSIVTMTTTGYGDQVPQYEFGRFVACCVMMFGALFLSMPLAIIGNEYESAWSMITEEREKKQAAEEAQQVSAAAALKAHERMVAEQNNELSGKLGGGGGANAEGPASAGAADTAGTAAATAGTTTSAAVEALAAAEEEKRRREYEAEKALVVSDPVIATQKSIFENLFVLKEAFNVAEFLSPGIMLQFCELLSNLPVFTYALRNELNYLVRERSRQVAGLESLVVAAEQQEQKSAGKRRLSVFGGGKKTAEGGNTTATATVKVKQLLAIQETGSEDETTDHSGRQRSVKLTPRGRGSMNAGPTADVEGNSNNSNNHHNSKAPPGRGSMNAGDNSAAPRGRGSMNAAGVGAGADGPARGAEAASPTASAGNHSPFPRGGRRVAPEPSNGGGGRGFTGILGTMLALNTGSGDNDGDSNSNNSPSGSPRSADGSSNNSGRKSSIARRQSMFRKSISKMAARHSVLNRFRKLVGSEAIEELRERTSSVDFDVRMQRLASDPTSLKNRIWILLELPHSSKEAKMIQIILIFLITFSIFILYTQTIVNLSLYGETTEMCGKVMQLYCHDKLDNRLDPGCFAHLANGTVTSDHLSYGCETANCFGQGINFGAPGTNVTCSNAENPPFQDAAALDYTYGKPYLFTTREHMNVINPICRRLECQDNSNNYTDVQFFWVVVEFIINAVFTVEITLRLLVCESIYKFMGAYLNVFDVLSLVPFYVELINTLVLKGFSSLDFSILASSPDPIFFVTMRSLKVFRMFNLTRHFNASKVITETAQRAFKQILGMISFLVFLVILFAILLYQVEGGRACFVGDENCPVPPDAEGLRIGDKIRINKNGDLTAFGNVFYGLWFSFVTLTSTGYGDIVPVTNAGQVMAIILMLMGSFYLAMPLTAAASTFYTVHQIYNEKKTKIHAQEANKQEQQQQQGTSSASSALRVVATAATAPATPSLGVVPAANVPVIYGDFLDRKLQKRVNLLLGELFLVQSLLQDFYQELHKTSTDFSSSEDKKESFVVVNNRKVPILQKLQGVAVGGKGSEKGTAGGGGGSRSGSNGQNKVGEAKSELLQQMQATTSRLEVLLSVAEEDVLRIVVLHHKLRKNF